MISFSYILKYMANNKKEKIYLDQRICLILGTSTKIMHVTKRSSWKIEKVFFFIDEFIAFIAKAFVNSTNGKKGS